MNGVVTDPASGSITYNVSGNGQLQMTGSGISYAAITAETMTGQTGAYFDVSSTALVLNVQNNIYDRGSASSATSGHIGLYVWGDSTAGRLEAIWHPGTSTSTGTTPANYSRVYTYRTETNQNVSTMGTAGYPYGTQNATMTVTSDSDNYTFQLTIGGVDVGYYTAPITIGNLTEVGFRFGTGTSNASGLFGDVSVSGEYTVIPEPSVYALGIAGLLGALVLIRRRR